MTNEEKGRLYDDYLRQSEVLQRENSKLKAEYPLGVPAEQQKTIDANDKKLKVLVTKLEDLYRQS